MIDTPEEHSYTSCADDELNNIGYCKRCTDLALVQRDRYRAALGV
jgi:hypothetical protein